MSCRSSVSISHLLWSSMNVLWLSSSRFFCQHCGLNKPVVVRVELSDSWRLDKQIWVQPCFTLLLHIFLAGPACPLGFLIPNDKDWFPPSFVSDPFCSLLLMLFSLIQPVNCEIRVWTFGLSASGITDGLLNLTFAHYYKTKEPHIFL